MNPIEDYLGERLVAFAKRHNANARGIKVLLAVKFTWDLAVVIGILGMVWLFVSLVAFI
jgi:hypothetical protein